MLLGRLFAPVRQRFIPAALSYHWSKALADGGSHTNNGGAEAPSITSRRAENSCQSLLKTNECDGKNLLLPQLPSTHIITQNSDLDAKLAGDSSLTDLTDGQIRFRSTVTHGTQS